MRVSEFQQRESADEKTVREDCNEWSVILLKNPLLVFVIFN